MARIPRGVEDDDSVGADQIDAKATSSGGNQEQKHVTVRVELVDQLLTLHAVRAAIQSEVGSIFGPLLIASLKSPLKIHLKQVTIPFKFLKNR